MLAIGCHKLFDLQAVELGSDGSISDGGVSGDVKLVFVSSVSATGAFGGLDGADGHCQERAAAAQLPGEYMAWLSTPAASPLSRMTHATIPYTLVGGAVIADNWDDLVDGQLRSAIVLTETGEGPVETFFICQGGEVWSNTSADGTWSGDNSCSGWTTTSGNGATGRYTASGAFWTETDCLSVGCGIQLPIYCFQQ